MRSLMLQTSEVRPDAEVFHLVRYGPPVVSDLIRAS